MRQIIIGEGVAQWVAQQLKASNLAKDSQGVGVWDGESILMGAAYNNYNGASVHMHVAKLRGVPFSREFVRVMLDYPFRQLKVKRITGTIASGNTASIQFARHLGARLEGRMTDALPEGDLLMFGLLRSDAEKWLNRSLNGVSDGRNRLGRIRERQLSAACA